MNSINDRLRDEVLTVMYKVIDIEWAYLFTFDQMFDRVYWYIRKNTHDRIYWKNIWWAVEDIMGAGYFKTEYVESVKAGDHSKTVVYYTLIDKDD